MSEDSNLLFFKPYLVPYGFRVNTDEEIDRKEGIIEPVRHSKWASPIVVVVKT